MNRGSPASPRACFVSQPNSHLLCSISLKEVAVQRLIILEKQFKSWFQSWENANEGLPSIHRAKFSKPTYSVAGRSAGLGVIWVHCIYCALYFYHCYVSSTSDRQALDPGGWEPLLYWLFRPEEFLCFLVCFVLLHVSFSIWWKLS